MTSTAVIPWQPPAPQIQRMPPPQAESDEQAYEMWFSMKGESTRPIYQADIDDFAAFRGGLFPLIRHRASDLSRWQQHLKVHRGLMPRTVNRKLGVMSSLFGFCVKLGTLPFNPAVVIRPLPAVDDLSAKRLTESDIHALMAAATTERNRIMLLTMYASGARASEIADLQWRDIVKCERFGQIDIRCGKGSKSRACLVSSDVVRQILALRPADATDHDPVFPSARTGRRLHSTSVYRHVRRTAERAGISKRVHPHLLRHAHASHSLVRGCKVHDLREQLGHSSLATTSRYVRAAPDSGSGLHLSV